MTVQDYVDWTLKINKTAMQMLDELKGMEMTTHHQPDKGFYIDFQFNYEFEIHGERVDVSTSAQREYIPGHSETVEEIVNLAIYIGNQFEPAVNQFGFIWRNNIHIPGMVYIRLRYVTDQDSTSNHIVLSRRTPAGAGDW